MYIHSPQTTRRIIVYLVLALLAIGLFLGWRPMRTYIKTVRSHSFLREATQSFEKNDLNAALPKALIALQLEPNSYEVKRLLSLILSKDNRLEALIYWNQILNDPRMTDTEYLAYVEYCLNIDHTESVIQYLNRFLTQEQPSVQHYLLAVQYWQRNQNLALAMQMATQGLERYPSDTQLKLVLAQVWIVSGNPVFKSQARTMLTQLCKEADPQVRLNAYALLMRYFTLSEAEKAAILSDTAIQKLNRPEDPYALTALRILPEPEHKEALIREALKTLPSTTLKDLLPLVRFLNAQQAYAETLKLISKHQALEQPELIIPYLDALTSLGRWDDAADIVFLDNLTIEPFLVQVFRTRVSLQLKNMPSANAEFRLALKIAETNPSHLNFLAEYFSQLQQFDFAIQAYAELMNDINYAMPAARKILNLAEIKGDTELALQALRRLNQIFPQSVSPLAGCLYLQLLLDIDVEDTLAKAQSLLSQHPDHTYIRYIVALGYLKTHNPEAALSICKDLPMDLQATLPAWKVIYVVTLAANNAAHESQVVLNTLSLSMLKPQERTLLLKAFPKFEEQPSAKR